MPVEFKETYKLAKTLKALCPGIESLLGDAGNYITSYHIKMYVFWLYWEYKKQNPDHPPRQPDDVCDMEKVLQYTRQLFDRLAVAYQNQWLEDFWIPGFNQLQDTKYADYGWCASNYARFIRWLLEPGFEHQPEFIKAGDCVPKPSVRENVSDGNPSTSSSTQEKVFQSDVVTSSEDMSSTSSRKDIQHVEEKTQKQKGKLLPGGRGAKRSKNL